MDMPTPPEIVLQAHGNLARVKELLSADPTLLHTMYAPWKEDPIGAASHVGNREIAEYLLAQGATYRITTAAMLGRTEDVKVLLGKDVSLANATGAHDISLLFHAAMSGVVPIVDMIVEKGGRVDDSGSALQGAAHYGHLEMVNWLIAKGANPNLPDYQGKTPLTLARSIGREDIAAVIAAAGGTE